MFRFNAVSIPRTALAVLTAATLVAAQAGGLRQPVDQRQRQRQW
jgi:hypothetical protein